MKERQDFTDFSESERNIINDIHRREFADMTAEEVMLYAEWVACKAKIEERNSLQAQALQQKMEAEIKACEAQEKAALAQLHELEQKAQERLARVRNGETKQI